MWKSLCLFCMLLQSVLPHIHAAQTVISADIQLQSPLTTVYYAEGTAAFLSPYAESVSCSVLIPEDAPDDIGIGLVVADATGRWYQIPHVGRLASGRHDLVFSLQAESALLSEPDKVAWSTHALARSSQCGLFLWSSESSQATIRLLSFVVQNKQLLSKVPQVLTDLEMDGYDTTTASCRWHTGQRWEVHVRPSLLPNNPYDPNEFALDAQIRTPQGETIRVPGFYKQPMELCDRGDTETAHPTGVGAFCVRYRPPVAGTYHITLESHSKNQSASQMALPPVIVSGEPWNEYIHVDPQDSRFYSIGTDNRFHWPVSLNLRSITDKRSQQNMATKPTIHRGIASYQAYLDRFAQADGNLAEVWMSGWNLGLEWNPWSVKNGKREKYPGYFGVGRYHEGNAHRLDRLLDMAWERNVRILLVSNHHGQLSTRVDAEWCDNPHNIRNGGNLKRAEYFFKDADSLRHQRSLTRYIIARYADHPAVFAWKIFTEVDLTDLGWDARNKRRMNPLLAEWHKETAAYWSKTDVYNHPVCTHWSTDYRMVYADTASLSGIQSLCIDAYHDKHRSLAELLYESMSNPRRGLQKYNKPILVTEYGGSPHGAAQAQMHAEHSFGAWAALVSGHAGAPMLWWYEWVDQNNYWQPYKAIAAFIKGEDLRSSTNKSFCAKLQTEGAGRQALWTRAWVQPGALILGYTLDLKWSAKGSVQTDSFSGVKIVITKNARAGHMRIEWWDPDTGICRTQEDFHHPGGALTLKAPSFSHHLAFKLRRK